MKDRVVIEIERLEHFDPTIERPCYQSLWAAGADIRAQLPNRDTLIIRPGEKVLVPTGIKMAIPEGYEVQVRPRSGLSFKTGLMVVNSPGTIDADYRGEVKILLGNLGQQDEIVCHGDRVAQLVVCPVIQGEFQIVEKLENTARGAGGFGSTGLK